MANLNERPRSIDWHGPFRETARIEFVWGEESNPIPLGFCIKVNALGAQERTLREMAEFSSYEAARERSIEVAKHVMKQISGTL